MSDQLLERFGKNFPAGTVLFREGDPGSEMYVIHAGRVQLTRQFHDRNTALATARTMAARYGWPPAAYDQAATFGVDQEVQNFVELEGGGESVGFR